jgi:hypothetical protein
MVVNRNGVPDVYLDDTTDYLASLHNETANDSGYFGETWSSSLMESLGNNEALGTALRNTQVGIDFPDSYLARQLETVARLIATRETRGVDTDTFYIETGGESFCELLCSLRCCHHQKVFSSHPNLFFIRI